MKDGELARRVADLGHALQEPWRKGQLHTAQATYGALREALGFEPYDSAPLREWRTAVANAVAAQSEMDVAPLRATIGQLSAVIDRQKGGSDPQVYLGMERAFPAMKQVLEAENCPDGTVIQATDTGVRQVRDGKSWREIPAEA